MSQLALSGCTFSWLHNAPLPEALRSLAEHGFRTFELTAASPHLSSPTLGSFERRELARLFDELQLHPISVNPTFTDLNLVSTDPEFQRLSEHHVEADIRLASDLGARFVVLIAGRRHALSPAPEDSCMWVLRRTLERLIVLAESLDVTICLENNPYGFLGLSDELLAVADEFDTPSLGIAFDVANALGREDPTAGVRRVAGRLRVAHVSDTHANRWQHTSPGRGEVDFAAFADALLEMRFAGPTVYELADSESPENRLAADIAALGTYGWSTDLLPSPTTNSAK